MNAMNDLYFAFQEAKPWLSRQRPVAEVWEVECKRLSETLIKWTEEYESLVESTTFDAWKEVFVLRLWQCWSHHWQHQSQELQGASLDGLAIAERLRGDDRNPDLFRDVILAEACLRGDAKAGERLYIEYRPVFETCAKLIGLYEADAWHDLYIELIDDRRTQLHGSPRLSRYKGYSSLAAWLRPVIRHFLQDQRRRDWTRRIVNRPLDDIAEQSRHLGGESEYRLILTCLRDCSFRAWEALDSHAKNLLFLLLHEEWSNLDLAYRLNKDAGHVSRLRRQAMKIWSAGFNKELRRDARATDWLEVLEDVDFRDEAIARLAFSIPLQDSEGDSDEKFNKVEATSSYGSPILIPNNEVQRMQTRKIARQPGPSKDPLMNPDHLLPNSLPTIDIDRELPIAVLKSLGADGKPPSIVCLDARRVTKSKLISWVERAAGLVLEKSDNSLYTMPLLVIVFDPYIMDRIPSRIGELDVRPVASQGQGAPADQVYLEHLRDDYHRFLTQDVSHLMRDQHSPDAQPLEHTLSPLEAKAWTEWIDDFVQWSQDEEMWS